MIRQNEVFPYYKRMCKELTEVYNYLKTQFEEGSVDELCRMRGYVSQEQKDLLKQMNVGRCELPGELFSEYSKELALVTQTGNFLLSGRFIIPVYDISGNLVSLIGYYPDVRKYITLPTPFFSRECMFFNFRQAYEQSFGWYDGVVFLVEGIFDCLSLRSIGLPAIATMGASVSPIKCELLKLFRKVIAIPDDDDVGRKGIERWNVPYGSTFIKFMGGEVDFGGTKMHCKDMDDFVSWYDVDEVRDILLEFADSKEEVEELQI